MKNPEITVNSNESEKKTNNLWKPKGSTDPDSLSNLILSHIYRTIPTALSYDVSLSLPLLGIFMTRLGRGDTAPSVTTLLNTIVFFTFAGMLPASFKLARLFGELEVKEKNQAELETSNDTEKQLKIDALKQEIIELKRNIAQIPKISILAGVVCAPAVLIMAFSKPILNLLGQNDTISSSAQEFFGPYSPFFLLLIPRFAMEFVLLSSKKQIAAMLIADLMLLITTGLEYALSVKTDLGLQGLGIASGIGMALTFLGYWLYVGFAFKNFGFLKSFTSLTSKDCRLVYEHLKIALAIIITVVSDLSASFAISIIAGLLPNNAVEIQNVGTQYLNLSIIITAAASQTTALAVSEQIGKAKAGGTSYKTVNTVALAGLISNIILQTPLAIFVSAGAPIFISLLGSTVDTTDTLNLLLITILYAVIDGVRFNLLQAIRSLGDNNIPSVVSSLALWLGVLTSYLLSQYSDFGVLSLPTGLSIGAFLGSVFLNYRLQQKMNPELLSAADGIPDLKAPEATSTLPQDRRVSLVVATSTPPALTTEVNPFT